MLQRFVWGIACGLTPNILANPTFPLATFYRAQTNGQDSSPESSPDSDEETQSTDNQDDRWHFSFQPYVTAPVSTYGSATVIGRQVNYSLRSGEIATIRVTASGRVEAWKGRWGFIVDGYHVSLDWPAKQTSVGIFCLE